MKKLLIVSLAATTLVACGKGGSKNPFKAGATANKARELQGTFQSECLGNKAEAVASGLMNGSWGEAIKSQRVQMEFKGDSVTRKEIHYVGANCDGDAYSFEESGTFKVGPKTREEKQLRDLDLTFKNVNVTMLSQSAVDAANKAGFCGRSNWSKDSKGVDVKGAVADTTCYRAEYKDGMRKVFNAYRTDGNKLILGDTSKSVVEASERPKTESRQVFTKK